SREQENRGKREQTDISAAVRESVSPFEAMMAQQGKTLETAIADGVTLVTDGSAVRQLVTLLTDNAVKYCDAGGVIRIALEQNKRGRGALLTVSNSYADGQGVDTSRFFDRFYRQDESHNIDRGGYGIGLSIAKSICENCGGSIEAMWRDGVISFICQLY
ncbi:MAG: sensor histidine kinase, partial [Lachnospiraceae bacterium]|nr:sensor histidine kinase [Lachnospiraceae bacterium]